MAKLVLTLIEPPLGEVTFVTSEYPISNIQDDCKNVASSSTRGSDENKPPRVQSEDGETCSRFGNLDSDEQHDC